MLMEEMLEGEKDDGGWRSFKCCRMLRKIALTREWRRQ